jgi:integrase
MSTAPVTANRLEETDKLLAKFEIDNIPDDYWEYYGAKRNNLFASIQGFREMWEYYVRLDAIWLRDTFAVDLLEKGVPLEEVSKLLGHESIKTTERHYSKWMKGRQDRLDNLVTESWNV